RLVLRLHSQFDGEFSDGNSPVDSIARARNLSYPNFASRLQDEVSRTQMRSLSVHVHVRARGIGINRTIPASHAKEHQLRIVRELQTQPVPASLFSVKLVCEELVVHPTGAARLKSLITQFDRTGSYEPCKRNIVRGAARPFRFLADAVFTMNDKRFFRVQRQVQLKVLVDRS